MVVSRTMKAMAAVGLTAAVWGQQDDAVRAEKLRVEASPLHQAAIASGGRLDSVGKANPANLYGSLEALMKASDLVILAHINHNSSQLSPSGTAPMTIYEAGIIELYKGAYVEPTVHLSLPTGMVVFADGTRATTAVQDFLPLENGGRYVLFLRSARGAETQITPGYRLVGGGVQGAFLLDDETVRPNFRADGFWRNYFKTLVSTFLSQVASLAAAK